MAASTVKMNGSWGRMALALVLSVLLLRDGVVGQENATMTSQGVVSPEVTTPAAATTPAISTVASTMLITEESPEDSPTTGMPTTSKTTLQPRVPDPTTAEPTTLETTQTAAVSTAAPETSSTLTATPEAETDSQQTTETVTSAPATDPVFSTATVEPTDTQTSEQTLESISVLQTMTTTMAPTVPIVSTIQCVEKEAVSNKDAVKLELVKASSCELTKEKIKNTATDLCEEDCKLYIFQEENSNIAIVAGSNIEANVMAMADKFNSEPIKDELGLIEATPHWGKPHPTVLVALLISGLALAALLIGGYVLKQRRSRRAKGMRLAEESYQADEENQGNSLVSVAPLTPPEHQQKPSVNGESPKGAKIVPPPAATNGHSTAKAPMADTEL
ncbi:hematopoietic progenitor cell antigen CD34-like [Anguilla rostrata]|uniref:hematopoietic progenitor cell antigen CD34-like n=1 Tax=Anguilla rostrata TaxID=7938 RepID=UPI0030CC4FDE